MRLVSLLPSATEIVYALGLGTSGMAPGDIDRYVRSRLVNGVEALASVIHPQAGLVAPPAAVARIS